MPHTFGFALHSTNWNRIDRRGAGAKAPSRRFRPDLFALEGRIVPVTFFVTTTENPVTLQEPDSIPGSLSYAIYQADQQGGSNTIDFDLGSGPQTIDVTGSDSPYDWPYSTALPPITCRLTIDGTCQEGYSGTPLIAIYADPKSWAPNMGCFSVAASGFGLLGVDIQNFQVGPSIDLLAGTSDARIQGDYIGTDLSGTVSVPTGYIADNSAGGNTIGGTTPGTGNLIDGNLTVTGAGGDLIAGNEFGTNAAGSSLIGTGGLNIEGSSHNTIGGTTATARNIIAGGLDLYAESLAPSYNLIEGNYVGLDAAGTARIPGSGAGIVIEGGTANVVGGAVAGAGNAIAGTLSIGSAPFGDFTATGDLIAGNDIGTNAQGTQPMSSTEHGISLDPATDVTIGGTTPAARNIIASSGGIAISVTGDSSGIVIEGNYIGLSATGAAVLGATNGTGILMNDGVSDSTIGGTAPGSGNVISGNDYAIELTGISDLAIEGNDIGMNSAETASVGNSGVGIFLDGTSVGNSIGGTATGAGNIIAYSGATGIVLWPGCDENPILSNSIHDNSGGGIGLDDANNNQPAPSLTAATINTTTGKTTITGSIQAAANTTYLLQFFSNPTNEDQGQSYVGSMTVVGGSSSGLVAFTTTLPLDVSAGHYLTATATDPEGNTSQFSNVLKAPVAVVSSQISYSRSGLVYNRNTGLFTGTITLTNTGSSDLLGPLEVVFANLTSGTTLVNATGSYEGAPYLTASFVGSLAPGQSVTIALSFKVATLGQLISYDPIIYLGSF